MFICTMLGDSICRFVQPVLMSLLLWNLTNFRDGVTPWNLVLATGISFTLFLQPFFKSHCEYVANVIAAKLRSSLRGIVYQKILNATQQSLNRIGTGKVVSLSSKDLKPIHTFVKRFPYVFIAPVEMVVLSILLWRLVGAAALTGILYLLLIAFYLWVTYKPLKRLRKETSKLTAARLTQIENTINAVRLVKMSSWEKHFLASIGKVRRNELKVVWYRSAVLASMMAIVSTCPVFPSFISLVTLMAIGHSLTPQIVFTTILLMATVEISFADYCYRGVYYATQFAATMERLENFLFKDNERKLKSVTSTTWQPKASGSSADLRPYVSLSKVTSTIGHRGTFLLDNVSVTFQDKEFVGIIGSIGSGKSSLLRAIVGELETCQGSISSSPKTAYVPQIPWLFSGTVRENIVFGEKYDNEKFSKIVEACALREDFERFPLGDLSFVGERGITLSGGQRARVGLARAIYSDADVYLLDDPLSAVDAKVGAHIVERCLRGLLGEKLVVLVTHRLRYLQATDRIMVMNNGCIEKETSYTESVTAKDHDNENVREETSDDGSDYCEDVAASENQDTKEAEKGTKGTKEDRQYGGVSWRTYWKYLRAGNSVAFLVLLAFAVVLPEAFNAISNVWLSHWTELPQERKEPRNLYIYSGIVGGSAVLQFIRAFVVFQAALRSSKMLHKSMLHAVLRAPVRFFDTSPTGRILNRFSSDVDCMDERLPRDLLDVLQRLVFTGIAIVLVCFVNFWVIIPAVPVVFLLYFLCWYYLRTSRETKRLSIITASPVFCHYVETVQGIETIRSHHKQEDFFKVLCRHQDHNTREWLIFNATQVWFGLRVDLILASFSVVVIFTSILLHDSTGATGLSITYAVQLVAKSLLALIAFSRMENWMTSTQRVLNYTELESEPGYDLANHAPEKWSKMGRLQFQNVSLRYYPEAPQALEEVSFIIEAGEKVGIVGRTGAGKSSLVASLFRMPEPDGKIFLGDVCLTELNLYEARDALTAIAQDPIFFTGTIRTNLDPFNKYDDEEIWRSLQRAHISSLLENTRDKLNSHVTERGSNFSVGERQLLCLARAMLQKKKVIVFDEATANVDYDTERLLHDTIKDQLRDCTVLTIAHRMTNIMSYDKVLVLDKGRLVEFDKPEELISKQDSIFAQLASSAKQ
ncbi:ATP-binding cassette sub-family C member 4-like [Oculina patagonica]